MRRRRGCRAGRSSRSRRRVYTLTESKTGLIRVIQSERRSLSLNCAKPVLSSGRRGDRELVLQRIQRAPVATLFTTNQPIPPTVHVLNAASIAKPHAIQHLSADLVSYDVHIAAITETHLKQRHADHFAAIDGYSLFRRDRAGRKGGGVAVYVNSQTSATVWTMTSLSFDIKTSTVRSVVSSQSTRVTNRQTDRITIPKTALT